MTYLMTRKRLNHTLCMMLRETRMITLIIVIEQELKKMIQRHTMELNDVNKELDSLIKEGVENNGYDDQ